jgi:hypothetical protein
VAFDGYLFHILHRAVHDDFLDAAVAAKPLESILEYHGGLLVMIPYLVGRPVMIFVAHRSDRTQERRYHAAIPLLIGAISLMLLGVTATSSAFLSVVLWCFVGLGIYSLFAPSGHYQMSS